MNSAPRPALSRDEVVQAALRLLDEVGLEGLTMRALAERLGVKAASLYWHLRDKDELADLLLEAINSQIPEPVPGLPWREQLERGAWAWRRVLLKHRDAARLAMGRFVMRPQTLRRIEFVLGTLRAAGLKDADTANAAYLIANFVPGFVAEETAARHAAPEPGPPPLTTAAPPLEQARLEIGTARRLAIRGDPSIADLYLAYGEGQMPEVYASNGVVTLLHTRGRKPSTLLLNATVPWEIRVRQGAAHLSADLRGLQLRAFQLSGGTNALELTAPLPSGTVPIQITGGASKCAIHRPAEVPLRLEARGGISHLTFDGQPFRAGGELIVQSPGYDRAADRYEVSLIGGVSTIVVDTSMPPETASEGGANPPAEHGAPPLAELPTSMYPNLVALADPIMNQSMDDRFRFGLNIILDGLERRLLRR